MVAADVIFGIIMYFWVGYEFANIFYNEVDNEKKCAVILFYPILFLIKGIKGFIELL